MLAVAARRHAGVLLPARARRDAAVRDRVVRRRDVLLGRALVRPAALLRRAARVLRPGGWVALVRPLLHRRDGRRSRVPRSGARIALDALSAPASQPAGRRSARRRRPTGFETVADEFFADDIEMTQRAVRRLPAARSATSSPPAERGTPRAELRAWLLESTAPLFAGVDDAHRALPRLGHLPTRRVRSTRRSGFPLALRGISSTMRSSRGSFAAAELGRARSRGARRATVVAARRVRHDVRDDALAPLVVGHADDAHVVRRAGDARARLRPRSG